jgi:hypothetical protein
LYDFLFCFVFTHAFSHLLAISLEDVATRDARTVFAYNLPIKANAQDIKNFFSKAGGVRDVRLIHDRFSKKSKGYACLFVFVCLIHCLGLVMSKWTLLRLLQRQFSSLAPN